MKSFPPHRAIELYATAAAEAGLPLDMISFTERESPRYRTLPATLRQLADPWRAFAGFRSLARRGRTVLLREFLTVPFLAAAPLYFPWRRSLWLVAVHNVQRATRRQRDRFALGALANLGFGLIVLESSAGLERIGIAGGRVRVCALPLVAERSSLASKAGGGGRPRVTLLGRPRPEKDLAHGMELIEAAIRSCRSPFELAVGTSDPNLLAAARARGHVAIDTTTDAGYRTAIAQATVVVLSYLKEDYEFRTSGVVLDAAMAGAAVVCPDFPVLRDQIQHPCPIGATYGSPSELPEAIERAAALALHDRESFARYVAARSVAAVGQSMAGLIERR